MDVDAPGWFIEAESRFRWERSTVAWWRRERRQMEASWWGAVGVLAAGALAGVTFLLAGLLSASEIQAQAERELRGAASIRQQTRGILCRTWPKECKRK